MEPATPKSSKAGRPKKVKLFRGTPKNETTPKCIQESTMEVASTNDANVRIPFLPVNEIWQRQMCEFFKIDLCNVLPLSSAEIAGIPSKTRPIRGDGNCFYRAISYLVSGTEEHHNVIRGFLLQHMLQIKEIVREPLGINNMEEYVDQHGLRACLHVPCINKQKRCEALCIKVGFALYRYPTRRVG